MALSQHQGEKYRNQPHAVANSPSSAAQLEAARFGNVSLPPLVVNAGQYIVFWLVNIECYFVEFLEHKSGKETGIHKFGKETGMAKGGNLTLPPLLLQTGAN